MSSCSNGSLFGPSKGYIKFLNGDAVAIDGGNISERLILNDLRIPYKQILKSRVILKPGQIDFLLNYLGIGDNSTFLMLVARYDTKSKIEEDNYVSWNYFDDPTKTYHFNQLLALTGNSTHRIPQLYLHNPNATYPVIIDVMVGVIDDTYAFFPDSGGPGSTINLMTLCRVLNIYGTLVILQTDLSTPMLYINMSIINSIERTNNIIKINKISEGPTFLNFIDEFNAKQSQSLINWVLEDTTRMITDLGNCEQRQDNESPVIYFTDNVLVNGLTGSWSTLDSGTFSATMSIFLQGSGGSISKDNIFSYLVDDVIDNRDGQIGFTYSNLTILQGTQSTVSSITISGTYSLFFTIKDIAENFIDPNFYIHLQIND
jgi:hypothetical protein